MQTIFQSGSRAWVNWGAAALGGVLYAVGFVGWDIWPLIWVCFVPVLFAIREATPKQALGLGMVFGAVTNLLPYYWVVHLLCAFAELPVFLAVIGYVLLCLYQGFLLSAVVGLVRVAQVRLQIPPVWSLPIIFPALEFTYPLLFPSFIGNAFYRVPILTQFIDLTGMLGLTGLIGLVNGGVFEGIMCRRAGRRVHWARVAVPVVALGAVVLYGAVRLPQIVRQMAQARRLKVALIQTNLGAKDKWVSPRAFIAGHQKMTQEVIRTHPDVELIVWPESAYNEWIPRTKKNVKREVMQGVERPLVFGALSYARGAEGRREMFNTAVAASSDGQVLGWFDKVELLAFGETLPLQDKIPWLTKKFPDLTGFTRGRSFQPFSVAGVRLMPMICYEDIIPAFVRTMWLRGGPVDALVNLTNDSWYGNTFEPKIHLALSSFRSIETRRALIRATNTGISALVDPAGRITAQTQQWTRTALFAEVPIMQDEYVTPYMRWGDIYGWASVLLLSLGWLSCIRERAVLP